MGECERDIDGTTIIGRMIPANYSGFLEHVRDHRQIGWIDWIANNGVNVPALVTVNYMGMLYAESIAIGSWMHSIDTLKVALSRDWIFQELAFGELDAVGC